MLKISQRSNMNDEQIKNILQVNSPSSNASSMFNHPGSASNESGMPHRAVTAVHSLNFSSNVKRVTKVSGLKLEFSDER